MFKKRIPQMDIYQEYRRSHERVQVMLKEEIDFDSGLSIIAPTAQENLQKFIKLHELKDPYPEPQKAVQNFVNLAEDTTEIPFQENKIKSDPQKEIEVPEKYFNTPVDHNPQYQNLNADSFPESNFQENFTYNQPSSRNNVSNREETNYSNVKQPKKIEDELEDIIRDALNNSVINENNYSSEIDPDPELIKLLRNNIFHQKENFNFDYQRDENFSNVEFVPSQNDTIYQDQRFSRDAIEEDQSHSLNKGNGDRDRIQSKAEFLEKQIKNQQAPPKVPTSKTTVKRPEIKNSGLDSESAFFTNTFEDDSSLTLTKQEISNQVKSLIRETVENNSDATKTNDLLELEKQLKEHIEKIKLSRNEQKWD
jgi:hypothetical protein